VIADEAVTPRVTGADIHFRQAAVMIERNATLLAPYVC
jgi:hypothetical protein